MLGGRYRARRERILIMKLLHHIPNLLSVIRIALALSIIIFANYNQFVFYIVLLCGITDVLDGYIARKYHFESKLGAKLDSWGDYVFFLILVFYFFIWHIDLIKDNSIFIGIVIVVRLSSLLICWIKNRKIYSLHTISNKITGLLLFIGILVEIISERKDIILFLLVISLISAFEELMIMIIEKEPDINVKSIFNREKSA